MSFESYHYDDIDAGYQPESSEEPINPPKSGSGVAKLTDSLIEDNLLDRIEAIEKRLLALENKRPEYVPSPVYGPITYQCPTCGVIVQGSDFHACSNSPGFYGRTDK
jgi:hypothetical protein